MRCVRAWAGLAGVAILCGVAAEAAAVTVTQQNAGNIYADAAGGNAWSGTADVIYEGTPEGAVRGGLFRLVADDGTGAPEDFVAFCFEFSQFFSAGAVYDTVSLVVPTTIDQATFDALDALYSNAYDLVSDGLTAAAFQFALWEISEDAGTGLDLSGGSFEVTDDGQVATLAGTYIDNIVSAVWAPTGGYEFTRLANPDTQDLIVAAPSDVPLPASALLLAAGLAGIGWLARRRAAV